MMSAIRSFCRWEFTLLAFIFATVAVFAVNARIQAVPCDGTYAQDDYCPNVSGTLSYTNFSPVKNSDNDYKCLHAYVVIQTGKFTCGSNSGLPTKCQINNTFVPCTKTYYCDTVLVETGKYKCQLNPVEYGPETTTAGEYNSNGCVEENTDG